MNNPIYYMQPMSVKNLGGDAYRKLEMSSKSAKISKSSWHDNQSHYEILKLLSKHPSVKGGERTLNEAVLRRSVQKNEKTVRVNNGRFYAEMIDRSRNERYDIVFRSRYLSSLTIGLSTSFFILVFVSVVVALIGLAKKSAGITESSLYVVLFAMIIGILASHAIERELPNLRE